MKIDKIISIITLVSLVFGAFFFLDDRHAQSEDLQKVEKKVEKNHLNSVKMEILRHIYFLRQQIKEYPQHEELKFELKESEEDLSLIKKQISELK